MSVNRHRSIFFDEWRACLKAHYLYVVQNQDTVTEPSLRNVLIEAGVTEQEIEQWHIEAHQAMTGQPNLSLFD